MKKNKSTPLFFLFFIRHKVAANLLMALMVLIGVYALFQLNIQFLPNINLNYITITVPWVGASASDVERSIIVPLEKNLKGLDGLKTMRSQSNFGFGNVILQFNEDANMSQAFQDTQQRISTTTNLPQQSERPVVTKIERYEPIGSVIITGKDSLSSIRQLAYDYEKELMDRGIAKVTIVGLPKQELAVKVSPQKMKSLGMTLPEVATLVNAYSQDASLGTLGKNDTAKDLRMVTAIRDIDALAGVPISDKKGVIVTTLGNIAKITYQHREGESLFYHNGQPAVELQLLRSESENAFSVATIMREWYEHAKLSALDQGVTLKLYDERWLLIKDRINLLIHNGFTGLCFIVLVLMAFLNRRVAFWVAVSIPVSCLAALYVLYGSGGSLNMISLFAIIMTLGIVVDDSIVVGENAYHEFRQGKTPEEAAAISVRRMMLPVLASSLTTIAAFIPLMIIKDVIGQILFSIPLVVICIIIASLVECFCVLPYHLKQSFKHLDAQRQSRFRTVFDQRFAYFRDHVFHQFLIRALKFRWPVVIVSTVSLALVLSLIVGGHVPFTFFKVPDSNRIKLNATFVPGTKTEVVQRFLLKARNDLYALSETAKKNYPNEPDLVNVVTEHLSKTADLRRNQEYEKGENVGHLNVELSLPDDRSWSNHEVIRKWRHSLINTPGLSKLVISSPGGGPPGRDIDISLSGKNPEEMKAASLFIQSKLSGFTGVENVADNLPGGREQWILTLKSGALAQGLTVRDIASQVGAGFSRSLIQRITEGQDEIDLIVTLPDMYRHHLLSFQDFPVKLPNEKMVRLDSLVNIKSIQGFDRLTHENAQLTVNVTADVDDTVTNANRVLAVLQSTVLNKIYDKYRVTYRLKGKAEEQARTFREMLLGMCIGFILIYMILALIFSSYIWPVIVMFMIPFGVFGAVVGHLLMGYDMTILSLFGVFGLSGIVMNDSIILLCGYKDLRDQGYDTYNALLEAVKLRLRPVILTSVTTIFGLIPILFETSLQAKFLIPMVISIVFGLLFTTALILLVLPSVFAIYERVTIPD